MLIYLQIQHFVLIDQLALDFTEGMTVFTGETGAGKSILCDALQLALGGRTDPKVIQTSHNCCHIKAQFDIKASPIIQSWLAQKALHSLSNNCLLERVIPRVGRSRALINKKSVPLSTLRELGKLLVVIQAQQNHHNLLKRDYQRNLLDRYGNYSDLLAAVEKQHINYLTFSKQHHALSDQLEKQKNQQALWRYHLEELEALALQPEELRQLDQEQRRLAHAQQLLQSGHTILNLLSESESTHVVGLLHEAKQNLQKMISLDKQLETIPIEIEQINIQISELESTLSQYLDRISIDPERLQQIDQRLTQIYNLARKHEIKPEHLSQYAEELRLKWDQLAHTENQLKECHEQLKACLADYQSSAAILSDKRLHTANVLQQLVTESIQQLGMPGGRFEIRLLPTTDKQQPTAWGYEQVEFYLSAAPGQALQPIAKCASGGELSRIHLAIQAIISEVINIPTLIFDEVDVGVGGSTAEMIGRLLKQLSLHRQVVCITHLPQVATFAGQHYQIQKLTQTQITQTQVVQLTTEHARIEELARMLGGMQISSQTLAHAQEMFRSTFKVAPPTRTSR